MASPRLVKNFQNTRHYSSSLDLRSSKPVIAVTMATGRQGTSVVKHLSKSNIFAVRAITRKASSKKASMLANLPNVKIVEGDLLEPSSLERCFSGAYGIFGNTTPTKGWRLGRGSMVSDYELAQGRNLIDVVKKYINSGSLKHFVFSSVCKPKDPLKSNPAPSHFSNKWSIEEYILSNGLKDFTTILRPVSYFENFESDLPGVKISENVFPGVVHKDKIWQTIAVDDIGLWTNAVFENRKKFLSQSLNIASEEMTGRQMAELWQKIKDDSSQTVKYSMVPRRLINFIEHDIGLMADWIERTGYGADLKALKDLAIELEITMTPLSNWLTQRTSRMNLQSKSHLVNTTRRFNAASQF